MPTLVRPTSRSAGIAVAYITGGILIMIWTAIWYYAIRNGDSRPAPWKNYVCMGLFLSGLSITIIGLLIGRIGREAKEADNAPGDAANTPGQAVHQDGATAVVGAGNGVNGNPAVPGMVNGMPQIAVIPVPMQQVPQGTAPTPVAAAPTPVAAAPRPAH